MTRTVIVTFKVPTELLQMLDELVSRGVYSSRSEALRHAVILLLRKHGLLGMARAEARGGGAEGAKGAG